MSDSITVIINKLSPKCMRPVESRSRSGVALHEYKSIAFDTRTYVFGALPLRGSGSGLGPSMPPGYASAHRQF